MLASRDHDDHLFDREIILDWYDAPVQSVVWCRACGKWFYKWLVAWAPGSRRRTYVFRGVADRWIERVMEALGEPAGHPSFDAARHKRVACLTRVVFSKNADQLFIAETDSPGADREASLQPIDPTVLGALIRPTTIESIVDQEDAERERLHSLVRRAAD